MWSRLNMTISSIFVFSRRLNLVPVDTQPLRVFCHDASVLLKTSVYLVLCRRVPISVRHYILLLSDASKWPSQHSILLLTVFPDIGISDVALAFLVGHSVLPGANDGVFLQLPTSSAADIIMNQPACVQLSPPMFAACRTATEQRKFAIICCQTSRFLRGWNAKKSSPTNNLVERLATGYVARRKFAR